MSISSSLPNRIILAADIGLDYASYEALHLAMSQVLGDQGHTLTVRLLAMHTMVGATIAEYGRGSKTTAAFSAWITGMNRAAGQQWLYQEAAGWRRGRPGRQRLALAPLIAATETRLADGSMPARRAGFRAMASRIASGTGRLWLPSLSAEIALEELGRVKWDQDAPELSSALVDRMVGWLRGGILLRHRSVLRGTQRLLACSSLTRWYASAVALSRGSDRVGEEELAPATEIVESEYVAGYKIRDSLARHRMTSLLYDLCLDLLVTPADLTCDPFKRVMSGK